MIKLNIRPEQNLGSQGYKGQGIRTIELAGTRLRVKGWYNESSPWVAEVELDESQIETLLDTAGQTG